MAKRILICPWGKYSGWKETEYIFRTNRGEEAKQRSYSTLPILLNSLHPDRVTLLVLDSLVTEGCTYSEVELNVSEGVRQYLVDKLEVGDSCDIGVLPGNGTFYDPDRGLKVVCKSDMENLLTHILWRLVVFLVDDLRGEEPLDFYLDLTHGINVLPVLTYKAVETMAQIVATSGRRVRLVVLNSEPYEPITKAVPLRILRAEERDIHPFFPRFKVGDCTPEYRTLNAFMASLHFGLPLVYRLCFPDTMSLLSEIEEGFGSQVRDVNCVGINEKFESWGKEIKIRILISITHKELDENLYPLVLLYLYSVLNPMMASGDWTSLKELRDLSESRFYQDTTLSFVKNELSNLGRDCVRYKDNIINDEQTYLQLIGAEDGNVNSRNFRAHIGLERSTIELRFKPDAVTFRANLDELSGMLDGTLDRGGMSKKKLEKELKRLTREDVGIRYRKDVVDLACKLLDS